MTELTLMNVHKPSWGKVATKYRAVRGVIPTVVQHGPFSVRFPVILLLRSLSECHFDPIVGREMECQKFLECHRLQVFHSFGFRAPPMAIACQFGFPFFSGMGSRARGPGDVGSRDVIAQSTILK
jgi:hypothetical protein